MERTLKAMMLEWEGIELSSMAYRDTGTFIIFGLDDILALLDDQIVKTQTMRSSPYIKPNEKECRVWERRLVYGQSLLGEVIYIDWKHDCVNIYIFIHNLFHNLYSQILTITTEYIQIYSDIHKIFRYSKNIHTIFKKYSHYI